MARPGNAARLALLMTEDALLDAVLELAGAFGWRTAHFRPSMRQDGSWRTAVQGDGKGFPDLVLVRDKRVIFAELKRQRATLSDDQLDWAAALAAHEFVVWRPADWLDGTIEKTLRGQRI